jgi:hypothetical protein
MAMNGRIIPCAGAALLAASLLLTGCGSQTVGDKPGSAPASINPTPSASGHGTTTGTMIKIVPIDAAVQVSADGKKLTVSTETAGCQSAQLVPKESSASVTLTLQIRQQHKAGQMCPQFEKPTKVTADLKAPLGQRTVFDRSSSKKLATARS